METKGYKSWKREGRRFLGIMLLLLVAAMGSGCRPEGGGDKDSRIKELEAQVAQLQEENQQLRREKEELLNTTEVTLYYIESTPTEFLLVPVKARLDKRENLPLKALEALIAGPQDPKLMGPLPKETRVLSLEVKGGTAYANFSREIGNFNGGSSLEALAMASIVNTLTEFPQIQRVQFMVEGTNLDTLGGHILIEGPLKRNDIYLPTSEPQ